MHKQAPDPAHVRSLLEAAVKEMSYLETLAPTLSAAGTIIRGIYENFRRLGSALLIAQGTKGNHDESIAALTELNLPTGRPLQSLKNLMRLRHEINYNGYQPTEADLKDVLSIKKECWELVLEEVRRRLVGAQKGI